MKNITIKQIDKSSEDSPQRYKSLIRTDNSDATINKIDKSRKDLPQLY